MTFYSLERVEKLVLEVCLLLFLWNQKNLVSGGNGQRCQYPKDISNGQSVSHYDCDDSDDSWDFSHRLNSGS